MINQSDCTIIIPHLGCSKESEYALDQCLLSLQETVPNMKRIVAFNGDECCRHDYQFEDIRVYSQGQCKAVNAAVATVNTPWVFITNDDMVYAPGWWEKLVYAWELQEVLPKIREDMLVEGRFRLKSWKDEIYCISPMLVEPREGAPTFKQYFCGGAGGDFDKAKWLEFAKDYKGIGIRTSFNLPFLIRKDLWDTVGGYDVTYDPWGSNSDSDLEYKIKLAGVQPYQNTDCIVYHFSQTSGTFEPRNNEYYQRNFQVFKDKWGFDRTDNGIWEANFTIPSVGEGRVFTPVWEGKYK